MVDLTFEDPPEDALVVGSGKRPGRYLAFGLALREHPGKWARLPDESGTEASAKALAQNIRLGKVKGFGDRLDYDTAVKGTTVWVRYAKAPRDVEGAPLRDDDPVDEGEGLDESARLSGARVREWARGQGIEVGDRGRLPADVVDAYREAMLGEDTEPPPPGLRLAP